MKIVAGLARTVLAQSVLFLIAYQNRVTAFALVAFESAVIVVRVVGAYRRWKIEPRSSRASPWN